MWPFKKKELFDITKPITNPALKQAFQDFNADKSEVTLKPVLSALKNANFLVLVETDSINSHRAAGNKSIVEKRSTIKFLQILDKNNDSFQPLFTDWKEIDLWLYDGMCG